MPVTRSPSFPPSGPPSYSPDNLPVYRGGSGGSAPVPWTPDDLFSGGEAGEWWDITDLSKLFQDTSKTTPAASVGDPIGAIVGNRSVVDLAQATTADKPLLRQDGALYGADLRAAGTKRFMTGTLPSALLANVASDSCSMAFDVTWDNDISVPFETPMEITATSNTGRLGIYEATEGQIAAFASYGASTEATGNVTPAGVFPKRFIAIANVTNGGRVNLYIYDSAGTFVASSASSADRAHEVGSIVAIGRIISNPATVFDGSLHRALCIGRALTESDRSNLVAAWSGS